MENKNIDTWQAANLDVLSRILKLQNQVVELGTRLEESLKVIDKMITLKSKNDVHDQ